YTSIKIYSDTFVNIFKRYSRFSYNLFVFFVIIWDKKGSFWYKKQKGFLFPSLLKIKSITNL
ncbi:MAG: hypothetical protein O9338_24165, partial [Microcystis sp. LE19-251.1A]|nr:hypothetical protein [Microcystis sp. LE19-251.1A]